MSTAAALVIGNEILTGTVQETNVALLARELFGLGVELRRVVFCRDVVDEIARDLDELRHRHDWVITSGGVGPTHDDVTIEAVARAFDRPVVRHRDLEARIRQIVGTETNESHLRMADVPEGADLIHGPDRRWPTVVIENVFVLPGLPKIFELKLPALRERIHGGPPFLSRAVYTRCRETDLVALLTRLAGEHHEVSIGSYPVLDEAYSVRLTFDSRSADAIERAVRELLAVLPPETIVDL
jgi:molybdenum cofactor synthesis domain-containing protein